MKRICNLHFAICILQFAMVFVLLGVPSASSQPPNPPAVDDVQDLVFLAEARPLLIRLHVRVDGKPLSAAWDDLMKFLFTTLDVNGDGALNAQEVERARTADQILGGGLGRRGFGGVMAQAPAGPTLEALDADKDGKVTPAELAAYYRKNGLAPVQMGGAQANPLGMANSFLGGRTDPTVAAVSAAAFARLDADKDGKLTQAELAAAPASLLPMDEDEDDIITARELVPDARPSTNLLDQFQMMAGPRGGANPADSNLVPLASPGEVPETLVRSMLERYGPKVDKPEEKRLGRMHLGLDAAMFARLDKNGDGAIDAAELAGFAKRPPDLEMVLRLGKKEATAARLEILPALLAEKATMKDGLAFLDLGTTRLDLQAGGEDGADRFSGLIRQQSVAQLKQADTNGDGVIDEGEAKNSRSFRGLFKSMDRDGDGKVTEQEMAAYFAQARELQTRARAACVSLVLVDQSRGLFDLLDANRDGRLSVREMRGAAALVAKLDRDGKGHLTSADIPRSYQLTLKRGPGGAGGLDPAAAFAALYGGSGSTEPAAPKGGPAWFRKMDRNRDGDVSPREFLFSAEQFRKIDTDGDGLISTAEAERYEASLRK